MLRNAAASGSVEAVMQAGVAALQAGADAEAVEPVRKALRKNPQDARLWHLLAVLHANLDDRRAAAQAFARAAKLAPDDVAIAEGHASVSFEAGLPSAHLYERAVRLAPGDRRILLCHAAAQIAEGRSETAIAGLERELLRNPGWTEAHAALSRVRWAEGDRDGFVSSFERALIASPTNVRLWSAYMETLLNGRLHERGLSVIARARKAAGPHRNFDAGEAIARVELGELREAARLFGRLAPLSGASLIVSYLRLLLKAGDIRQAADVAEKSAPHDASNQIWPYLSLAWRLLGDSRWQRLEGDPRFIGVYDISDKLPPLDKLADRLRTLHRAVQQPLDQSLRGGTQTEGHLFWRMEPEIRKLRKAIEQTVREHVAQLPAAEKGHPLLIERRSPIDFSGAWSVRLTGGGRHVAHTHPGGWLSSALYITVPAAAERGPGEAGWLSLGAVEDLGISIPPIRLVEPRPGRLVLFPSTMWHGTRPFGAGERLTVAFDVERPGSRQPA
jgi:Flp pilus assembly protein TadD